MSWHSRGIIRELFALSSSRQFRAEKFPSPTSQSASSTAPLATCITLVIFLIAVRLSGGLEIVAVAEGSELRLLAVAQVDSGGVYLHQIVSESVLPLSPIRLGNAPAFGQATSLGTAQIVEILRVVAPELASRTWAGSSQVRITRRARALGESDLRDLLTATLQSEFVKDKGDLELRFSRPWAGIVVPDETLMLKVIDLPASGIGPNFIVRFELLVGSDRLGPWQVVAQARVLKEVLLARAALKRGQPLQEADFARERRDVLSLREPLDEAVFQNPTLELIEGISAGQPLLARAVRMKPVVQRGHYVNGLFRDGTLNISLKVEVLADGLSGQTVRVRNPKTKREFYAKVQDQETVIIHL